MVHVTITDDNGTYTEYFVVTETEKVLRRLRRVLDDTV